MKLASTILTLFMILPTITASQGLPSPERTLPENRVLTHREQAPIVRSRIAKRFETILPELMRREGIDMWIMVTREYNNDPVFQSMSPLTTYSSRRRTILVFYDRGEEFEIERLSIGRFDYGGLFALIPTQNDAQYEGLRQVVSARDPRTIGINISQHWNHADGLTANEHNNLKEALGPKYTSRLVSAEMLAVGWLEVKLPEETDQYRSVMRIAHQIIAEAFSNKVIVPGITTTEDVRWWMRQRVAELGLGQWFHPSIRVQRMGGTPGAGTYGVPIQRGDMIHTDFGIVHLGYSTDTQHNAYVLLPGENDAPAGLKAGLAAANRLQDLNMEYAKIGVTGNQALAGALEQAKREGLKAFIYSHPIGYHGHGAGPPIGMTDYQDGVPVRGDAVLRPNTWRSIELNVRLPVPEWDNQEVHFALEENAVLAEDGWHWIDGRQSKFYLIR
tara:strand:- start:4114 stop:5448 length:1335 start_codon:yes stop_codon:yes gene_type:complete